MRAIALALLCTLGIAHADEPIRLLEEFSLSPDGATLYFGWRGDVWSAATTGGAAQRLTAHAATERLPRVSPDGKTLAFVSNRTGANQVYVMPATGGAPEQVTFHSEGSVVTDWFPDGKALLIKGNRDHFWRRAGRYFLKRLDGSAEVLLFDEFAHGATLSPDGRHLLFNREGVVWWRKGYNGSQAAQIWSFDTAARTFRRLTTGSAAERRPLWHPDGKRYYFAGQQDGAFNLYRRDLEGGKAERLTSYDDDGVISPTISRDGKWIVFRQRFDLYRLSTTPGSKPERIDVRHRGDRIHARTVRSQLSTATQAAFSDDGREIAFVAGGDVWVMDTELREPRRITKTPGEERDPVFSPDHQTILYVSEDGEQCDIYAARRGNAKQHWWENESFKITRITDDPQPESSPRFISGGRVAFTNLRGDLWTMNSDGKELRLVLSSWDRPAYSFSPDGAWLAYAIDDNDFNRDIWIRPADGSGKAVNVSRHPDWEGDPVWSPDGKMLAFVGRRNHEETDIHFVYLDKGDHDESKRDRTLEKARKKMKGRKKKPEAKKNKPQPNALSALVKALARDKKKKAPEKKKKPMVIDFDGISDRIRRVRVEGVDEADLFWSHDSKRLAFSAKIDGKAGVYTIAPPDDQKPKLLTTTRGGGWRWLKEGNQIVGLAGGRPTAVSARGVAKPFAFRVQSEVDLPARNRAAFDLCWRTMRDNFYDERLNNRDWSAVGRKYREMAGECVTGGEIQQVVTMMLGELNGSHLGFTPRGGATFKPPAWREPTPHFGARYDRQWKGPGLRVADVIKGTPAWRKKSRLHPGDVILSADGRALDPTRDLAKQLNGPASRDVRLKVKGADGKERTVVIRPIAFSLLRRLLYDHWIESNIAKVNKASGGALGYLHVRSMNWSSFERFEAELYKVGHGKQGLLIDVRDNGGGFTADHLLTVLCQPVHAITIPRGGGEGYPQGRMVYARWHKPIVVLCNQNSFSNAEILSHAIKSLKRGRLVGVETAGGVISTGGRMIMGFGFLRMPFRAWFVAQTGEDMERRGCVPDFEIWPEPEEWTRGHDRQLAKGIEFLLEDVRQYEARPRPPLRYRAEEAAARSDTDAG